MAGNLYRTITGQSVQSDHSDDPGTPIHKTTTTDPLSGTLNHLTEHQHDLLDQFKTRLEKDGWWTREGVNGKPSHDDGTLLRYLRARKFDIAGAIGQFSDTEKWSKEQRVEELYENFDVDLYEKARRMYPQWTGHRDRRGIPLYVYVIKHLDSKNVSKYSKMSEEYKSKLPNHKKLKTPAKLLPLFALYHNLLGFVLPMCSTLERPNPEIPITNSTNIVDISGVGLSQFWNLKAHMQDASVLATAHYPETLDRIFIIGAPSFFPTVWGWIKRWFDPVTVSKIFILGKHEVTPTLSSFIEAKDFPKRYGGKLEWEFGDLPHVDEAAREALEKDGHKGWVPGPALWLDGQRVLVGSENGKLRRKPEEIAKMKPIVYAADDTEVPVHPERKASISNNVATAARRHTVANSAQRPEKTEAAAGAAVTAAAATTVAVEQDGKDFAQEETAKQSIPPSQDVPGGELQKAPMDGSPIRVRETQAPNLPTKTAEYLSSESSVAEPQAKNTATVEPAAPATAELSHRQPAPEQESKTASFAPAKPPPGQPQPGPLSAYQVQVSAAVAARMQGESISTIPEQNGVLPHPEITVVSDPSLGLAIETDKLALASKAMNGHSVRPAVERFVTAAEF